MYLPISGAQGRWSLDFFEETCPPAGSPEASLFSVYRAPEPQRRFRYAHVAAHGTEEEGGFGLGLETCAERLLLEFHDFARRKRRAEGDGGDGFAYYLWGVVLRQVEGQFEGFNLGSAVDEDLADEQTWKELRRIQEAGQWGEFEQAQLFIGCRDALTPCHYDLLHNAYVQVKGWKRFLLIDPRYSYGLYPFPQGHPMDRCARADLEHPDYQRFPRLSEVQVVEAVLGPGDVLILPCGWYHHVQSLTEDSLSVSFWFSRASPSARDLDGPRAGSVLSSLERILLAREVEALLLLLWGASGLAKAFQTLRSLWEFPAEMDPEMALTCAYLVWRLRRALGRLDETVWDRWVPCPEAFHPEHDIWRARAATLEALRTPAPDAATVEAATAGLPEEEVASFWRDFVPEAQKSRGDWPTLWSRSQAIAARFGRKSLAVYERMVGRYVLLLRSSVTNEIIRDVGLDTLMGNWRLHLLFHDAILEGKAAYVETLKSPQSLVERAKRMDDARLLDLIGLLRPDDLRFEDLKFRYVRDLKQRPDRRGFITNVLEMDKGGFYSMLKFLLAQQPLTPLWLPKARLLDSGAWAVEGYEEQKKAPGNPLTEPMLK
ncbi:unnamed protein product [Durusdinium trenchii]|uniref:JmjC domain-containing protein n=1 Tax=Durusdinium trenchii TaxID=1381693 RepID=A0ABP0L0M8_9DINO